MGVVVNKVAEGNIDLSTEETKEESFVACFFSAVDVLLSLPESSFSVSLLQRFSLGVSPKEHLRRTLS